MCCFFHWPRFIAGPLNGPNRRAAPWFTGSSPNPRNFYVGFHEENVDFNSPSPRHPQCPTYPPPPSPTPRRILARIVFACPRVIYHARRAAGVVLTFSFIIIVDFYTTHIVRRIYPACWFWPIERDKKWYVCVCVCKMWEKSLPCSLFFFFDVSYNKTKYWFVFCCRFIWILKFNAFSNCLLQFCIGLCALIRFYICVENYGV